MSPGSCGGSLSTYSSSRRSLSRGSRRSLGSRDGSARGPPCPVGPPRWYTGIGADKLGQMLTIKLKISCHMD